MRPGYVRLENTPEIQKYPKTFIHDCSLPYKLSQHKRELEFQKKNE